MQNLWPSCDIEATPLKAILIKQWSLIIKQPDVKGWDNIFFKINEKSNGKQIKNTIIINKLEEKLTIKKC